MILTQSQIELENSLRRILPTGVVSCWIPDGYGRAKDIIGGNHGTCFGTHPNVPIIGSPIAQQIHACDATTGWVTGAGGSISLDEVDFKEGTGSIKNTIASPGANSYYYAKHNPTGSWDWSDKEHILLWLYCDRASTAFTNATFSIYDTSNNYKYWNLTFSAGGWTAIRLVLSTYDYQTATPPDLALINWFHVQFKTADTTPFYYKLDDIRVTAKPSHTNPSVGWRLGGDDYVDCGNDKSLDVVDGITIGGWVNSQGDQAYWSRVVNKTNTYWLGLNPANDKPYIGTGCAGGTASLYFTRALPISIFTLLIGTYNSSDDQLKTFINGNLDTQSTHPSGGDIVPSAEPVIIGGSGITGYNAYIVFPFVANGPWSAAQAKNFYLNTKSLFWPRG